MLMELEEVSLEEWHDVAPTFLQGGLENEDGGECPGWEGECPTCSSFSTQCCQREDGWVLLARLVSHHHHPTSPALS